MLALRTVKLESLEEELNVIIMVRHSLFLPINNEEQNPNANIVLNFDINTKPNNTANRFNKNHIESFIQESWGFQEEILKQIEGAISVIR